MMDPNFSLLGWILCFYPTLTEWEVCFLTLNFEFGHLGCLGEWHTAEMTLVEVFSLAVSHHGQKGVG